MQEKLRNYLKHHQEEIGIVGQAKDWTIEKLAQGEYNINYLMHYQEKKWVLRLNTGSQMQLPNQIDYEYQALLALKNSGRTPRAIYVDATKSELPFGFLIMEFLEGRALDYRRDLESAAQCLADIHAQKTDTGFLIQPANPKKAMIHECESLLEHYTHWQHCDREIAHRLERMLRIGEKMVNEEHTFRCLINTELNSGNFIVSSDNCYLVDWEKPLYADPAQDLGHFLAPTTTLWKTEQLLSKEQMMAFVRRYCDSVGERFDTKGLWERTMEYVRLNCLRGLSWSAMAWVEYQDPNRLIQNEDTRRKLEQYLQYEFLDTIYQKYLLQ